MIRNIPRHTCELLDMGQKCSGQKRSPPLGLNSSAWSANNYYYEDDDDDYSGDGDDVDGGTPGRALPLFSLLLVWSKPNLTWMTIITMMINDH